MRKIYPYLLLAFTAINTGLLFNEAQCQEIILQATGKPEPGYSMQLVVPLFEYKPAFYYGGRKLEYKLPAGAEGKKTALGFPSFRGSKKQPYHAVCLLVIGYDSPQPLLFVDTDFDYDFGNEAPLQMKDDKYPYSLKGQPAVAGEVADFGFALSPLQTDSATLRHLKENISQSPITYGNLLLPTDHWYEQINYNIIPFLLSVNKRVYKIGIMDWDNNLVYGDKNTDKIMQADEHGNFSASSGPRAKKITDRTELVIGEKAFLLKQVDPGGKTIVLESLETASPTIVIGSKVPSFSIPMVDKSNSGITRISSQKKYTLLDFWGTWCVPCMKQFPELQQLQKDFKEKLTIVGMNKGDTRERIIQYAAEKNVEWQNGIATDEILKLLSVESFPTYILLDKSGKVIAFEQTVSRIRELIDKPSG